MKEQPKNQASGASETARLFCTRISSAAGVAGELCTTKRKEPDMGKRNTNSWEGQRPRCPHVRITGNEDVAPPAWWQDAGNGDGGQPMW